MPLRIATIGNVPPFEGWTTKLEVLGHGLSGVHLGLATVGTLGNVEQPHALVLGEDVAFLAEDAGTIPTIVLGGDGWRDLPHMRRARAESAYELLRVVFEHFSLHAKPTVLIDDQEVVGTHFEAFAAGQTGLASIVYPVQFKQRLMSASTTVRALVRALCGHALVLLDVKLNVDAEGLALAAELLLASEDTRVLPISGIEDRQGIFMAGLPVLHAIFGHRVGRVVEKGLDWGRMIAAAPAKLREAVDSPPTNGRAIQADPSRLADYSRAALLSLVHPEATHRLLSVDKLDAKLIFSSGSGTIDLRALARDLHVTGEGLDRYLSCGLPERLQDSPESLSLVRVPELDAIAAYFNGCARRDWKEEPSRLYHTVSHALEHGQPSIVPGSPFGGGWSQHLANPGKLWTRACGPLFDAAALRAMADGHPISRRAESDAPKGWYYATVLVACLHGFRMWKGLKKDDAKNEILAKLRLLIDATAPTTWDEFKSLWGRVNGASGARPANWEAIVMRGMLDLACAVLMQRPDKATK